MRPAEAYRSGDVEQLSSRGGRRRDLRLRQALGGAARRLGARVWRVSKAGGTRGGSRAISGSVTKAERPAGGGSMPRLRERGSAGGGFWRSIRVASAFSPRRSTGHPSFYGLLLSQRERQGDWFRARSPTSA